MTETGFFHAAIRSTRADVSAITWSMTGVISRLSPSRRTARMVGQ